MTMIPFPGESRMLLTFLTPLERQDSVVSPCFLADSNDGWSRLNALMLQCCIQSVAVAVCRRYVYCQSLLWLKGCVLEQKLLLTPMGSRI